MVRITATATAVTGRYLVSAGSNHFVSDARPQAGGPGEAVQAGQLLLASLASCGLGLIQSQASAQGITLQRADAEVAFQRHAEDKTRYEWIRLAFTLAGVNKLTAQALLDHFTGNCPIFNTLRRGGVVLAEVTAVA